MFAFVHRVAILLHIAVHCTVNKYCYCLYIFNSFFVTYWILLSLKDG